LFSIRILSSVIIKLTAKHTSRKRVERKMDPIRDGDDDGNNNNNNNNNSNHR